MNKIKINDSLNDIIIKLSDGNPGAITTLDEMAKNKENDLFGLMSLFFTIDNMELYGSHLYMLWNDCCDRDIEKTIRVIHSYRCGLITDNDIKERIKNVGYGKPFDDLLGEVNES